MVPDFAATLFWDVALSTFEPEDFPDYTIARVLEHGDDRAYAWLRELFPPAEIARVLRHDRRLSRRSAGFWALVYQVPRSEVAALR